MTVSAPDAIGEHRPVGVGLAGDQEDRKVSMDRVVANHPGQLDSAGARHAKLGQDQVDPKPVKLGHRRAGGFSSCDAIAALGDPPGQHSKIIAVGLHDQDARSLRAFDPAVGFPDTVVHPPGIRE